MKLRIDAPITRDVSNLQQYSIVRGGRTKASPLLLYLRIG